MPGPVDMIDIFRNSEAAGPLTDEAIANKDRLQLKVLWMQLGVLNEAAIEAALKSGHIAGLGIDVWMDEPPPVDHPLLQLPNVIGTWHTAGITYDSRVNMGQWNADQVAQILRGEKPPRLINPHAWEGFARKYERVFGVKAGA